MSELEHTLASVVAVFALALAVHLLVRDRDRLSSASVLVFVGLLFSLLGVSLGLSLSSELVVAVLLPVVVFEGTLTLDVDRLRRNAPLVAVLTVVGLPLAVLLLGVAGTVAFGFPLLVSLLFAAIILPTDPAAVLSLFEEFEVSERLAVTIEGESLLNDGVAIVLFSTLLSAVESAGAAPAGLATPAGLARMALDVLVVGGGGLLLGGAVGYLAHRVASELTDKTAVLLLTVVVAYGSFLLAEAYLGLSGVLAVVGSGLLMGAHERTHAGMSESEYEVQDVWEAASSLVTTALYVLIGAAVPASAFGRYAVPVVLAAVLVVVVRALTVYPLVGATNRLVAQSVPRDCQHIMVWGGLHTVVPVALALALPTGLPFRGQLQTMVFGVAVLSIVGQGLLMPAVLERVGLGADSAG